MQRIIKNDQVIDETWHLLAKDVTLDAIPNCDDVIVPLALWVEHGHALKARDGDLGVWLEAGEEIEEIADDLAHFQVIALNFPPSPTAATPPPLTCCAPAMATRVKCVPSATSSATSCSPCAASASMPSPCVPTRTRSMR